MGFWIVLAKIIKIVLKVKKYINFLKALDRGDLVGGLVRSYFTGPVVDALTSAIVEAGIPLDSLDFEVQAEEWASTLLEQVGEEDFANFLGPVEYLKQGILELRDRALGGRAVVNGLDATRNPQRAADPIVLHRGEFERKKIDIHVSGAAEGMDFKFQRVYRSGASYFGPLGPGWDHVYNLRIREEENSTVLVHLTGQLSEHRYVQHPKFGQAEFSYYVPPNGVHSVFVTGSGPNSSFVLKRLHGASHTYEPSDQPREHRIRRMEDRFGNYLQFEYTEDDRLRLVLVNSSARYVSFLYDERGRLRRLQDHTGRAVVYDYDDYGWLGRVAGPALSGDPPALIENYEYVSVGGDGGVGTRKLAYVRDWMGRVVVENSYATDPLSDQFGRVIRQMDSHGESTFEYTFLDTFLSVSLVDDMSTLDVPTLSVLEIHRNGHCVEHLLNDQGQELQTRERFFDGGRFREAITRKRFNADGDLITRLEPDGTLHQFLLGRENFIGNSPWNEADPTLSENVSIEKRMGFGLVLAEVVRARRLNQLQGEYDPGFWKLGIPSVTAQDNPDDTVTKYVYDRENQLPRSKSDPRYTVSPDPFHVESAGSGSPVYDSADPRYIDHQRHLSRFQYLPGPQSELHQKISPDRTRPSDLNGVSSVSPVVEQFVRYDDRGRLLERIDARGYHWFQEYYSAADGAREGFLKRALLPHLDLLFNNKMPRTLEVVLQGRWTLNENNISSSGNVGASIRIRVEGIRIALHQSISSAANLGTNMAVQVRIDGEDYPSWDQTADNVYLVHELPRGLHTVDIIDAVGAPIALGRAQTHVSIDFAVDELGRNVRETDSMGNATVFTRDAVGRNVEVARGTAPLVSRVSSQYDPSGRLIAERKEWRDERGILRPERAIIHRYVHDATGLLLSESIGAEIGGTTRTVSHFYDSEGNPQENVDARGGRTMFEYDARNHLRGRISGRCTTSWSVTEFRYDLVGREFAERNARGAVQVSGYRIADGTWRTGFDAKGRVRVASDAIGNLVVVDYDALDNPICNRLFQNRDGSGEFEMLSRTAMVYDEHGDLAQVTDAIFDEPIDTHDPINAPDAAFLVAVAAGQVRFAEKEHHLDAHGNIVAVRHPEGAVERWTFDSQNRWIDHIDGEGRRTRRVLNGNGYPTTVYVMEPVKDATLGTSARLEVFVHRFEYDSFDRQTVKIDPYGNRWLYGHDSVGNRTSAIDPLGNVIRYEYNAFEEQIRTIKERRSNGLGSGWSLMPVVTSHEYDANGNVIAVIDPMGRRIEFKYDPLDRLISSRFVIGPGEPTEPAESRKYDKADNLIEIVDRNGLVKRMEYDLLDQHVKTQIDSSGVDPANKISGESATSACFEFDAAGRLVRHENHYADVRIKLDSRGLPTREILTFKNIAGAPSPAQIQRGYDLTGRLTRLVYPSGRVVQYSYDESGHVTSVRNVSSPPDYPGRPTHATDFDLAQYRYTGARLSEVELSNGLSLKLKFDGRGHVLERHLLQGSNTVWRVQRLRDVAGKSRIETSTTHSGSRSRKFVLDSIYQLESYRDSAGQWLDPTQVEPPQSPIDHSDSDGQHRLDTAIGELFNSTWPPTFQYDTAGNRLETEEPGLAPVTSNPGLHNEYTSVDGTAWEYDANGNQLSDGSRSFLYDLNNCVQQISDSTSGSVEINFYRDAAGRIVAETTPTSRVFRILNGNSPLVEISSSGRTEFTMGHRPEVVLHVAKSGEDFWITTDGLLSVRVVTDSTGNVVSMPNYRPFGASEDAELNKSPIRMGFAGMTYAPDPYLYHSATRAYRPDVGRYLQRDPAGLVGSGDKNLYRYVWNSPADYLDLEGLNGHLDAEERATLMYIQEWVDRIPEDEFHPDLSAGQQGQRAHLALETVLTFPDASQSIDPNVNLQRIAVEVQVDDRGFIRAVGRDPGAAGDGWRTIDAVLLREGVDPTDLLDQRASDVIEVNLDYKTGRHQSMRRVRHMENLTGAPYVRLSQTNPRFPNRNVVQRAEAKLSRWARMLARRGARDAARIARNAAIRRFGSRLLKVVPVLSWGVTIYSIGEALDQGNYGTAVLDGIGLIPGYGDAVDAVRAVYSGGEIIYYSIEAM